MSRKFKRDRKGRFARVASKVKKANQGWSKEIRAREKYGKANYAKAGGIAKSVNDYTNSRGAFKNNMIGGKAGRATKAYRKVRGNQSKINVAYAVSSVRGRRAARNGFAA